MTGNKDQIKHFSENRNLDLHIGLHLVKVVLNANLQKQVRLQVIN